MHTYAYGTQHTTDPAVTLPIAALFSRLREGFAGPKTKGRRPIKHSEEALGSRAQNCSVIIIIII